jgi:hypothetical protein
VNEGAGPAPERERPHGYSRSSAGGSFRGC